MSIKVIGAGTGRTGTVSMKLALEQLGFGSTYHMYELFEHSDKHKYWKEAFKTRKTDWNELLAGYSSITDYPGCEFFKELYDFYPGSKVILTSRSPESWYESARKTIYTASPNPLQKIKILFQLPFNSDLRKKMPVFPIVDRMWDVTFEGRFEDRDFAIEKFKSMEQNVIDQIPEKDLLIFKLGDGWKALCEFLEVPVPNTPYPRTNQRNKFQRNLNMIRSGKVPPVD